MKQMIVKGSFDGKPFEVPLEQFYAMLSEPAAFGQSLLAFIKQHPDAKMISVDVALDGSFSIQADTV